MCMSVPGRNSGRKKPEPLEVVEVQVREQDVQLGRGGRVHRDAERAHAGPGVEHERVTALRAAPRRTTCCRRSEPSPRRARRPTPATPDPGPHQAAPLGGGLSQNTTITPCISSCRAEQRIRGRFDRMPRAVVHR